MSSLLDRVDAESDEDEAVGEQKEQERERERQVRVDEVYSSDEEEGKAIKGEEEEDEEEANPYRTLGAEFDGDGGDDDTEEGADDLFGAFEEAAIESKGGEAAVHVIMASRGEAKVVAAEQDDDQEAEEQAVAAVQPRLGIPPLSKASIDVIKSAMQGLKLKPRLGADALADALLASGQARIGDEVAEDA